VAGGSSPAPAPLGIEKAVSGCVRTLRTKGNNGHGWGQKWPRTADKLSLVVPDALPFNRRLTFA